MCSGGHLITLTKQQPRIWAYVKLASWICCFLNCLKDIIPHWTIKKNQKKEKSTLLFRGDNKVDDPAMLENLVSAAAWCSKKEWGYSLIFFSCLLVWPHPQPRCIAKELFQWKFILLQPGFILDRTVITKINPSTHPSISQKSVGGCGWITFHKEAALNKQSVANHQI